ncbi:hypothetical protein ACP2W0_12735 [Pseudobacillus badius]|uniref:hypothetical protein n=1 Tax=Bacillus badius TaxID=1455 RepID=UPI003CF59837
MLTFEEFENGINIFFPSFLEGYRERFKKYYSNGVENKYFYFCNPTKLTAVYSKKTCYFIFTDSEKDEFETLKTTSNEDEKIDSLQQEPHHLVRRKLLELFNIQDSSVIEFDQNGWLDRRPDLFFLTFEEKNHHLLKDSSFECGGMYADWHYHSYELEEAIKQSVKPSSEYQLFDAEAIMKKVDTESFRYEFEESIKAYNTELYLAASATAGIALENLLRILITHHLGAKALPEKTYIWESNKVLKKHRIVDGRLAGRIESASPIRNSTSHTNTGRVDKETVDETYRLIKDLVDLLT